MPHVGVLEACLHLFKSLTVKEILRKFDIVVHHVKEEFL